MSKTKQLTCTVCGTIFTGSLYASPKTAKCESCKKTSKVTPDNRAIHSKSDSEIEQQLGAFEVKPLSVLLNRNRQEIEATITMDSGEVIERVPVEWKKADNKLDYLSVSKINTYLQCPAKFARQYINGDPSEDTGNIFTWFGSIMHEVTENMTKMYYENGIVGNPVSLYNSAWQKRQLTDMGMYKQGLDLINDYYTRHPIGSEAHRPFMHDGKLSVELEWRGQFGEVPVFGNMFDYIGEINEDTAIILDYKTNRMPYTPSDLENSLQLAIYEVIARQLFPQYKNWITGYELFFHGWQQCPTRTDADLAETVDYVNNVYRQMQSDNTFDERLNQYCAYCNYRHECKKYCDFVNNPKREIDTIATDKTDFDSIAKDLDTMTNMEKIIKKRKDELADIMKTRLIENAKTGEPLVANGNEYYLQSQSRPSYNFHSSRDIMLQHGLTQQFNECLTINKTKLDKIIAENPQVALDMQRCLQPSHTAPYLQKKKAKKSK